METDKDSMTAEHSLEIIKQHIAESREQLTRYIAKPLMVWGCLVTICALIIGYLSLHCGGPVWNFLWFVMTAIGFIYQWFYDRHKKSVPSNFISKAIGYTWASFAVMTLGMVILIFLGSFYYSRQPGEVTNTLAGKFNDIIIFFPMASIIILLMGMAATISGALLNNKGLIACAIIGGLGGFMADLNIDGACQMLVLAAVAVLTLIVPGIMIALKYKREK